MLTKFKAFIISLLLCSSLSFSQNISINSIIKQFKDIDTHKGTFLYFTDIYQCIGCNTDDLTNTIQTICRQNPSLNHILIVKFLQNEEISFFKKKFNLKYVIADPDGSIIKQINPSFKTTMFFDSSEVLSDFNKIEQPYEPIIIKDKSHNLAGNEIAISDDEQPIIVAFKSIIQDGTSTLAILDDLQNAIFFVDINTGKIINKFEDDGTLKYYFIEDTSNFKWKKSFDRMANPVIANLYLDPHNRQINALVMVHSLKVKVKFNIEKNSNDTMVILPCKMLNLKFIDFENKYIDTISINADYSIYKNMLGINNGIICERENQIKIPFDSVAPVLFKINYHSDSISNFMMNKDIQNQRDCIFNYNYGGYLTLGNNKEIYYFNPENGVFVRLNTDKKSGENVELIKPGGILKDVFHDYDCKDYSKTIKGYICFGMTYFNDKLVIYLVKSDSTGNINESKIQVYQNQEFIREFNPTFNDEDDILLKSYLIGHKDDWILMLNKWKNKRWVITKVNIN